MQLKKNKEMEFETLKKSHKKQIIIGALAVCVIGSVLTYATSKAKYKVDGEVDLAKGIVNYKPYDFKIMAMYKSENGTSYSEINAMPSSGYVINEDKTYCTTDNKTQIKGKIKTVNGIHGLYNISKSDKCYLYFDKKTPENITELIASLNPKTTAPNFSKAATTDEGVYSVSDGMYGGTSYYWRGAATTNYVKFAGFCWRIVRINGDKTIRLIYDGTTCHANGTSTTESIAVASTAYNPTYDASYYVGWTQNGTQRTTSGTASNAKTQLESWYSSNITGTNAQKVTQGKYCNDRDVGQPLSTDSGYVTTWSATGTKFRYAGIKRLYETYAPTLSCPTGDVYQLSVGLITADEVEFAGGKNENNTSYYLYNGQNYWTMSPSYWDSNGYAYVFFVDTGACLYYNPVRNTLMGLRPVINLKSDITFSGGNGTQSNPYVVE